MPGFSETAWARNADLIEAINTMPFNTELASGTLSKAVFQEYMIQDSIYLVAYARALAAAAVRAPEPADQEFWAEASRGALVVEQALHGEFLQAFDIDLARAQRAEPSPSCLAYTSFLVATAMSGTYAELIAAVLPCFWVYHDVGTRISTHSTPDNFYQKWIDTYADESFGAAVIRARDAVDRAATEVGPAIQDRMHVAFRRCTQFEWMFWDAAYRLEAWPV